jgi:hypothetical protein
MTGDTGVVLVLLPGDTFAQFVARIRDRVRNRYPGPWEKAEEFGKRIKARFRAKGSDR